MSSTAPAPRMLLPKPDRGDDANEASPGHVVPRLRKNRGPSGGTVACNECRQRKVKCDGQKPECEPCLARRQACTYRPPDGIDMLKRRGRELEKTTRSLREVLELLRVASPDAAVAILDHLRHCGSVAEMVDSVDSGILAAAPPSLAPSPTAPAADLLPTRSAVDSDLSLRYSNAFPLTSPLEVSAVDFYLLGLGRRDDPFPPPGLAQWPSAPVEMEEDWPPFPDPGFDFPSPASGTGFEAHADPRLELLEVRQWSSVPIPDALAARAISFYLINEHPSLAFFDAGLFVRDLVSGGGEFCSPLLVSSLLAWACGSYAPLDPAVLPYSEAFLEEAKLRWAWEGRRDALTTVSAAALLTLISDNRGKDNEGLAFLDAGAEMGSRLGLFGDESGIPTPPADHENDETKSAASFVAWGFFGWQTLHSLYWRRKHRLHRPPSLPIPGDAPEAAVPGPPLPSYMGSTFTWSCKLWVIVYDMIRAGFLLSHRTLPSDAVYRELLTWSDSLPDAVKVTEGCPHHVIIAHIWFHTIILDLWRPSLDTFQPLKRLVYLYRKRFESRNPTMLVTFGYKYLLNEVIGNSAAPESQFYFIVALRGYLHLARWSYAMCGMARAFFSMGSRTGIIQRFGAEALRHEIQSAAAGLGVEAVYSSSYPIDLELADDDMEGGNMESLANEFRHHMTLEGSSREGPSRDSPAHDSPAHDSPILESPTSDAPTREVGTNTDEGGDRPVWRGVQEDLDMTLSEVPDPTALSTWDVETRI